MPIVANLRHDTLEDVVTEEWLESPDSRALNGIQPAYLLPESLSFLYQLAKNLKQKREIVRGKPEPLIVQITTSNSLTKINTMYPTVVKSKFKSPPDNVALRLI